MSDGAATKEYASEIKDLGDKIVKLTLLQAKSLTDYLKEVHGIEAAAGGAILAMAPGAAGGAGGAAPEAAAEKNAWDVVLSKVADATKKIAVIKVVREITGLGLKEAKEKVDSAPQSLKSGVPTEDAEAMKQKLETAGATVELK